MGRKRTEREKLEDELIRIDRTLAADRKLYARVKEDIDKLVNYRLTIESRLCALETKQ